MLYRVAIILKKVHVCTSTKTPTFQQHHCKNLKCCTLAWSWPFFPSSAEMPAVLPDVSFVVCRCGTSFITNVKTDHHCRIFKFLAISGTSAKRIASMVLLFFALTSVRRNTDSQQTDFHEILRFVFLLNFVAILVKIRRKQQTRIPEWLFFTKATFFSVR